MWSFGIVVFPPLFDQDLCFAKRVEDLAIQQLIAEPCFETFTVSDVIKFKFVWRNQLLSNLL